MIFTILRVLARVREYLIQLHRYSVKIALVRVLIVCGSNDKYLMGLVSTIKLADERNYQHPQLGKSSILESLLPYLNVNFIT